MPLSDDEHCPGEASPTETLMAIAQAVNTADCSREVRRRVNALVDQASAELAEAYRCGVMHERTGYVRDERDQPAQSIDDVERAAKWILANVVTTSVTVVTAEMSLAAEFAAVRAETAQKFLRSEAAKPDNYAGDPGKWSCLCGKTQRTCPCFLRGCEVGAANATEPRTAEDQPAVEHVAIVVSAARDLIGYLGTTGKDRDLTPSHDRYVRTLRGALNVLESRRERGPNGDGSRSVSVGTLGDGDALRGRSGLDTPGEAGPASGGAGAVHCTSAADAREGRARPGPAAIPTTDLGSDEDVVAMTAPEGEALTYVALAAALDDARAEIVRLRSGPNASHDPIAALWDWNARFSAAFVMHVRTDMAPDSALPETEALAAEAAQVAQSLGASPPVAAEAGPSSGVAPPQCPSTDGDARCVYGAGHSIKQHSDGERRW